MNMSGIDVARISFAIWFLLPSFLRIIWLIFNRVLFWLFKLIFKCSRVVAGSPNNNVSSLATLAVSNETLEVSEQSMDTVDEASSDQPSTEPVQCVESNNSTNESTIENDSAQNAVESVDASDSSEVILIVERQEHIEKIFSALFHK